MLSFAVTLTAAGWSGSAQTVSSDNFAASGYAYTVAPASGSFAAYDWMDGCYYNSNGMMVILNPSAFSDSSGGVLVGKPSNGYISALSVKTVSGLPPLFIASGSSGSDSTYVPDYWCYYASRPCLFRGGYCGQNLSYGMFYVDYNGVSSVSANIGCRLQKLP